MAEWNGVGGRVEAAYKTVQDAMEEHPKFWADVFREGSDSLTLL